MYYTWNLTRGVVQQGCYDDSCRSWRGEEIQLPAELFSWTLDMEERNCETEGHDPFDDSDNKDLLEASEGY